MEKDTLSYASDPTPRGGIPGPCPPQLTACAPPSEDCAPKKLIGSGLWSANRGPLVFFVDLKLEKTLEIPISAGKSLEFSVTTFYFYILEVTCFLPEKPLEIDFGRKIPLNFCTTPCSFDPDRDKFLVPPCPFRIHTK